MISPDVIAAAQASHQRYWPRGPFCSITLAQYGLESAWGRDCSGVNNTFGIKATQAQIAAGECRLVWTKEQDPTGHVYTIRQYFANYPSLEACFDAHASLLTSSHYAACENAQTPEAYAMALHACGYATDIHYATKLIDIINESNLKQYDQTF